MKKWGLEADYFDVDDISTIDKLVKPNTKMVWIETPTNPLLKIINISHMARFAKKHNLILAVDNTFASPYFQKPIELGADIVVHSTTKYLAGHSDVIGGAVLTSDARIYDELKFYQNAAGAVPGPWDSWLVLRGIKTLAVRMKEHNSNAAYLAKYLKSHKKVEKAYYPGFSGMISFELTGGLREVRRFLSKLKLFSLAESLGGVESLVCYPPKMTHASFSPQEREVRGIKDNLLRLSVGIENKEDLKNDLRQALG